MDDEAETYKLWRIRKTVMQVSCSYLSADYATFTVLNLCLNFSRGQ